MVESREKVMDKAMFANTKDVTTLRSKRENINFNEDDPKPCTCYYLKIANKKNSVLGMRWKPF